MSLEVDGLVDGKQEFKDREAAAFLDEEASDLILLIDGQRLPVSRSLLSIRSEYFQAMFNKQFMNRQETELELNEDGNAFKVLLKYIYTSSVNLDEMKAEQVVDLYLMADKYLFRVLSKQIAEYLKRKSLQNIKVSVKLFLLAKSYGKSEFEGLMEQVFDYFPNEVLEDPSFAGASLERIVEVLSRDTFHVEEIKIFRFVQKWVEAQNPSTDGPQGNLIEAYSLVRFPLIAPKELLGEVVPVISSLDLDLNLNINKYRGSVNWREVRQVLVSGEESVKFLGPQVVSFGHLVSGGYFWEFAENIAFDRLELKVKSGADSGAQHEFQVLCFPREVTPDSEEPFEVSAKGMVRCRSIPVSFSGHFEIISQTTLIASKVVIMTVDISSGLGFELKKVLMRPDKYERQSMGRGYRPWSLSLFDGHRYPYFEPLSESQDRKVFLVGVDANRGSALQLRHSIPSDKGLTFKFLQTFVVNRLKITLPSSENKGLMYGFDVLLLSDDNTFVPIASLLKEAGQVVEVSFKKRPISMVRIIGTQVLGSNRNKFSIEDMAIQLDIET